MVSTGLSRGKALASLIENTDEVRGLYQVVRSLSGGKRGPRPEGTERLKRTLNKSALVLVVACWEAFVEDVALAAFDFMLSHAKDPNVFPKKVLVLASKPVREDPDERRVWELAGDGWQKVLRAHRGEILGRIVEPFHLPVTTKVDSLIGALVGFEDVSREWHWKGMSKIRACQRLDELIRRRGEIAHRVSPSGPVYQKHVQEAIDHVSRLAAITSNRVAAFVSQRTGKAPWIESTYRRVR